MTRESRAPTWKFQECLACSKTFRESTLCLSDNTYRHMQKGEIHTTFGDHI
jgi:hypothetical protein